ncbi:uncharacterized protein [Spinacia oleracea]|uniref:Integrase catalytic domain-containing protein n=1 Tax=Spinacia oleracea TaxID=3562 RepID=A0ABM3QRV7_SPIOL|nr:uncharacterized protein LOC130461852 [Spinacia oleracea]
MDLLGPYTAAPGGRRYVIVAVDYFTKWVEAEALKNIRTSDVRSFIRKNIMTRFRIPQAIVFDNGPHFETPKLKEWLTDHGIKKKLDEAKGRWADDLPNVLWSIRTTAKNSIGETPFLLAYGAEAVLPTEMYEPTLRVMLYDENANWEMMKMALDFLPEVRGNAALRQQLYKLRMAREYNKKVSKRVLKGGDFVLRKMESIGRANEQDTLVRESDDLTKAYCGIIWCLRQKDLGTKVACSTVPRQHFLPSKLWSSTSSDEPV